MEPWERARELPASITRTWREPSRWRELAGAHRGGRRYLELPQFVEIEHARAIEAQVRALPFSRLTTSLLDAERRLLAATEVEPWLDLLQDETLRGLVGAVLDRPMPRGLVVNAWRLSRGDYMGVHPDGRFYRGTISLGLCDEWEPADGGAIAFGDKRDDDELDVAQRWYPRLGDLCLFAPDTDTWHCVEAVQSDRVRLSLTGWWVEPEHGLTRGR